MAAVEAFPPVELLTVPPAMCEDLPLVMGPSCGDRAAPTTSGLVGYVGAFMALPTHFK